jgi:hypothetical protein
MARYRWQSQLYGRTEPGVKGRSLAVCPGHEQHVDRARADFDGACGVALQPQPSPPEAFTAAS